MKAETASIPRPDGRPVSAWLRLTGGSVGIVAGFGVDLLRLGACTARRALAAHCPRQGAAGRGWPCRGDCNASTR